MDKLKMRSPDLVQMNIANIREKFPGCVTEARDEATGEVRLVVDFDQLRQELSGDTVEGEQERYRLDWPGKRDALARANAPINKTLRPATGESLDFEKTRNLFIEGDNLDAMKLLQETYLGKIKMIYMDPPYNTGKDLIYQDNRVVDQGKHDVDTGQRNEEGERLVANLESDGRFHSKWLTMITSRIRLAKNFLTQDGAIFVSCDENEHPRLRLVMDEIFGKSNFVADMVWAAGRKNNSRLISVSHEYIVCYVKDAQHLSEAQVTWRQHKKGLDEIYSQYDRLKGEHGDDYEAMIKGMKEWYRGLADGHPAKLQKHYCNIDKRGIYFPDNISSPGTGGPKYEVLHPVTKKPVKAPASGWRITNPQKMKEMIEDDRIHFGETENSVPCIKSYLKNREFQTPYSVFYQDGRAASKRLHTLMGGKIFDFPKDETVLQEIIEMLSGDSDIVLDCFAGSSTTAHSVMLQNAADGGNRRFIMVQFAEPVQERSDAFEAGYRTIADIARERIRRAGARILDEECHAGWNRDVGFRVLKVDTSNMRDVFYRPGDVQQQNLLDEVDNVKQDRTAEDLLFQVLIDWGVDPTLPIRRETIEAKTVYFVDDNARVAFFDMGFT